MFGVISVFFPSWGPPFFKGGNPKAGGISPKRWKFPFFLRVPGGKLALSIPRFPRISKCPGLLGPWVSVFFLEGQIEKGCLQISPGRFFRGGSHTLFTKAFLCVTLGALFGGGPQGPPI